jgi:glycosyltransferase involved in cell wall biosynthesis
MKVLYDPQIFERQNFGGISRYFYEIINNINNPEFESEISIKYTSNSYLLSSEMFKYQVEQRPDFHDQFLNGKRFLGKSKLFKLKTFFKPSPDLSNFNYELTKDRFQKQDFDIFHPTYYKNYFLPYLKNKPFVLTIHDLIHELYPEFFPLDDEIYSSKKELLQKASHIISVSNQTKSDLMKFYDIPESKISVIYHGNSLKEDKISKEPRLDFKYLLYVGQRKNYKNFYFFVSSISSLLKEDKRLKIICTGENFNPKELTFLKLSGLEDKVMYMKANDHHLHYLYSNAEAFVFPSLYEGFGIPVLEAFSCGCPCLLSTGGSLPEIGGDAALYFNPKDPDDIRNTVNRILTNKTIKEELIFKGKERLKNFSWEKASVQTYEVYKKVLDKKGNI